MQSNRTSKNLTKKSLIHKVKVAYHWSKRLVPHVYVSLPREKVHPGKLNLIFLEFYLPLLNDEYGRTVGEHLVNLIYLIIVML